ncbi:hypothetical protein GGI02_004054 [Coemansia sp. RSA 2322]|nr:hypothetical protein GGI02_004054 [Coemansia sp. RSA 2322]
MAYAASDILVRVNSSLDSSAQADIECFGSLLTQLYQFGTNIEYVSRGSVALANLKVDAISNLVRVAYYDPDANRDQLTQLVRVNSSTLQYLDISSLDLATFTDLVKCEDGDYTTYPCLHDLELDLKTRWDISNTPVFEGVVPFPKLRRLYIVRAYPFGDDTLFRGNAGTLEHLQFQPTSQAVDMLRQHGVFRPASHPNLYSVKIDCGHFRTEELPGSDMHLDYMLSIAPKATVWNMPDCVRDDSMCSILGLLGTHTNLQHLFLPSMVLGLTDVVTLIKSLPLLSDLYVDYPRLDVVPDGVPSDELPSYMISTYAPMGERFRSWHCACFYKWRASDEEIAKCILLLALVCPNFNKASVSSDAQKALMDAMRKAVNSAGFERHAWQLRHMHLDRLDMAKC